MNHWRDLVSRVTRPDNVAVELAVGLVVLGLVFLAFAWEGIAALLAVPLQLPYAISGGFGGLALVGLGLALYEIQMGRRDRGRDRDDIDDLIAASAALLPENGRRS